MASRMNQCAGMKDLAIVLALSASACMPRQRFVDTGDSPVSDCGAMLTCTQGGDQGSLLLPLAALAALTVGFAVAIYIVEPLRAQPHVARP